MNRIFLSEIYEIVVGTNPATEIRYHVGQQFSIKGNKHTITTIEEDVNSFALHGVRRYLIYVGDNKVWQCIENMPVRVVCSI